MAETSKIQWTDATWNIARGCSKVDEDCKFCYMYRDGERFKYDAKQVIKTKTVFNLPLKLKEPSKIFTSSLTDVFHEECDSFRDEMWDIIRRCPQHTFQILTKRPERIEEHLPHDWGTGWANVWLGTSVGSQKSAHRIVQLLNTPAKTRFLSIEPLFEEVNLTKILWPPFAPMHHVNAVSGITTSRVMDDKGASIGTMDTEDFGKIDWVIVGGESGNETGKYRYRECKTEWIETIITQCRQNGIPVFVKQLGTFLSKAMHLSDRQGGNIDEWPEYLQVRQFPKT